MIVRGFFFFNHFSGHWEIVKVISGCTSVSPVRERSGMRKPIFCCNAEQIGSISGTL